MSEVQQNVVNDSNALLEALYRTAEKGEAIRHITGADPGLPCRLKHGESEQLCILNNLSKFPQKQPHEIKKKFWGGVDVPKNSLQVRQCIHKKIKVYSSGSRGWVIPGWDQETLNLCRPLCGNFLKFIFTDIGWGIMASCLPLPLHTLLRHTCTILVRDGDRLFIFSVVRGRVSVPRGEGARGRGEQKHCQRAARVRDVRGKGGDVQRAQSYRGGPLSTVSTLTVRQKVSRLLPQV